MYLTLAIIFALVLFVGILVLANSSGKHNRWLVAAAPFIILSLALFAYYHGEGRPLSGGVASMPDGRYAVLDREVVGGEITYFLSLTMGDKVRIITVEGGFRNFPEHFDLINGEIVTG